MKKRILTVFLALALCVGQAVPAFAAPSAEDAAKCVNLSIKMGDTTFEYIKQGEFGDRIIVNKDMKLTQWDGSPLTGTGYNAATSDTVFTATHSGSADDGSYITICSTAFVNNGSGVYEQDWYTSQVLTQDGEFLDVNVAYPLDKELTLKAGQSVEFKLPTVTTHGKVETDVFYFLEIYLNYPNSDTTYTMGLLPFKLDDAAVDAYFAEQKSTPAFTDVPSWFEKEVAWAVEKGITNGYGGSTTFAPTAECPHTQILTFLWRAENKPTATAKAPVTVASYYQDAVNWAYEKGLIDASFNPDALCTRAQAVQYIWQARGKQEAKTEASFTDVTADATYTRAVSWAVEKGVTKGYGGSDTFAPNRVCNRGEIAAFLYRAYNN
ncbi:MAG: S-layer homology domain-containing protein [Clostridiales bacterium]|nr:S-layer homology domain-containing protein [Clostridiales bacterium]